mmetsp:Transcript_62753/g.149733  ORF Transcript_62753/g.149733 Transcript_62753/m.149733 type:complete len:333 (+) Transcript_62753:312-1310(+)
MGPSDSSLSARSGLHPSSSDLASSGVADAVEDEQLSAAVAAAKVAAASDRELAALHLYTAERSAEAAARLRHFTAIEASTASALALDAEVRAALAATKVQKCEPNGTEAATTSQSSDQPASPYKPEADGHMGDAQKGPHYHRLSVDAGLRSFADANGGADHPEGSGQRRWSIEGEYDEDASRGSLQDVVDAAALELAASAAVRHLRAAEADADAAESLARAMDSEVQAANMRLLDVDIRAAIALRSQASPPSATTATASVVDTESAAVQTQFALLQAKLLERDATVASLEQRLLELSGEGGKDTSINDARDESMEGDEFFNLDEIIRSSLQA